MRLAQPDLTAILRFLSDVDDSGVDEAYGPAVLEHLRFLENTHLKLGVSNWAAAASRVRARVEGILS